MFAVACGGGVKVVTEAGVLVTDKTRKKDFYVPPDAYTILNDDVVLRQELMLTTSSIVEVRVEI